MQRLPNGNTVIVNWAGHSGKHEQPQVFELTPDKQVVWQVSTPELKQISNVQILNPDVSLNGVALR